jgi:hypothetical protein
MLAAVACLLLPATPAAAAKEPGPLAPPLAKLARPAVRALPPAGQAERLGFPVSGPGSLLRRGNRIVVKLRFDHGALSARGNVVAAGGQVIDASRALQSATVAVPPADLEELARVPGLASVSPLRTPILYAVNCEGGSVVSEGLGQLHVDEAREAFDLRGNGVTVGVLSDTYDTATEAADGSGPVATKAANDVLSADLPGPAGSCSDQQLPVNVLAEGPAAEGADEGRGMLQIVHDLAPHAKLAFATAFESEESFAENIERLAQPVSEGGAGADVIVDDVGWFEEPFFQDGPIAAAIDKVTAEGVTYLTAAGNDNLFDEEGNEIGSWEAPEYRDSGECPEAVEELSVANTHCMDFDPGAGTDTTFGVTVEAGETLILDLQWGEPWNGVATDLNAYLLNTTGEKILTRSTEKNVTGTQEPVEIIGWENKSASPKVVQLAINRAIGLTNPRLKFALLENGGGVSATEYPKSSEGDVVGPTVTGHAGAPSAISVAAVPFNDSTEPEPYSSRGPVVHLFSPVEGPLPAAPLGSPEVIAKPDVAATDCGVTTFFADFVGGKWRFCGTSAAAPHAAAVAALLRQAEPSLSAEGLRAALTETADPVGAFGPDAVGGGLVNAFNALASLPGPLVGGDGPSEIVPPLEGPGGSQPSPSVAPPVAPNSSFLKHPRKVVSTRSRTARVVFGFGSDQAGASFRCRIDAGAFRACGARIAHRFGLGVHSVKVAAVSSAGLADPTPALFRFRVKHVSAG